MANVGLFELSCSEKELGVVELPFQTSMDGGVVPSPLPSSNETTYGIPDEERTVHLAP